MEAILFASIAVVLAFSGGLILTPVIMRKSQQCLTGVRVQQRAVSGASLRGGWVKALLRNGIAAGRPCARLLLRSPRMQIFFSALQRLCQSRGLISTPQNLCSVLVVFEVGAVLLAGVLSASFVFGILAGAAVMGALGVVVRKTEEARLANMREAIPEALRSMSVCFHAGLSLLQTFQQVADEVDEPLKTLFTRAAHDLETGHTAQEALLSFKETSGVNELSFVAVALDIQHKSGGSLQQVLDTASDSIRAELALRRNLQVQTAQAKLSARVVSIMPFALVAIFSLVTTNFLAPFFQSVAGFALLGLAAGMQFAGIMAVRRLLDVEVG